MQITFRRVTQAILVAGVVATIGCEGSDPRLKKLAVGMPKDSVVATMGEKAKRVDPYLYNGRYIEAMYYPRPGKSDAEIEDRKMAPVVVINGKLAGWGWAYWDSVASSNHITVAK